MKHFLFIFLFLLSHSALAEGGASLSLSPSTGSYPIGDEFTVSVNVDTAGQPINAVEGQLSYNKDELEVTELSTDGSILESWTTAPIYSNAEGTTDGTVSFGGSSTESFTGSSGKIFSVTFRALKNADAQVRFSTGAAILGADGLGTNILTVMNEGAYTLTPKEVVPIIIQSGDVAPPTPMVLGASTSTEPIQGKTIIISSTHPDENKWYNQKTAAFEWNLPSEANTVRLSVNADATATPVNLFPPIHEKVFRTLKDGISYFHFQIKGAMGWNEPTVFRFQTDTEKPDAFKISEASPADAFGFIFDAHDKTSGIEKYLVQIDNGKESEWRDDGTHKYIPENQEPGPHVLSAKAVDFAGNFATSSIAFTLAPIDPPVITDFQEKLVLGNSLVVRGKARPNTSVSVWVRYPGSARSIENKIISGNDGTFTFVLDSHVEEGIYEVFAETIGRGVRSNMSPSVLITVSQPKLILLGKTALDYLSVLIPLVTLVLLLIFIIFFAWHRFKIFRMTLQKEVEEVETASRESFSALRKEINENERMEDGPGTPEEKRKTRKVAAARLKKKIDAAEAKVEKEISDVKKKVKKAVKVTAQKVE